MLENNKSLEGVVVSSADLVGLRAQSKDLQLENRVASKSIMDGAARSSRRGRGMEFSEVRHYQAGDDIRNIDWRVTARTQETYTKLFQEEKERPVYLLVDQRQSMFFGSKIQFKSVLAAKTAACIAWSAFNNRDKIGALVFSDSSQSDLRPKQGKQTLFRFLHELSEYNRDLLQVHESGSASATEQSISIEKMMNELQRVARPGSLVFVISDFHDMSEDTLKPLSILAKHNDVEFIHIADPLESSLPKISRLPIAKSGKQTTINSASHSFQSQYSEQWQKHVSALHAQTMKLGVKLTTLQTGKHLDEQLRLMFRKASGIKR